MSVRTWPIVRSEKILGVDWSAPGERLPLGGLSEALGWRVDRYGYLRSMEGLSAGAATITGDRVLEGSYYTAEEALVVASHDSGSGNVYIERVTRDLSSSTVLASGAGTDDVLSMVEMHEKLFINQWDGQLLYWDTNTATFEWDLTVDLTVPSLPANLSFNGISRFDSHLIGYGYGDESPSGIMETGKLGPDRPEIVRWSHLGAPLLWRKENWIVVGVRDSPVLTAHQAFGRLVVLKSEGSFLLWGSLEENLPQLEQLHEDTGRAAGCVGPNAAAVADGILYWISPAGPMRWRGGATAEYIGRPVEGSFPATLRTPLAYVVAAPEIDAVLFCTPAGLTAPTAIPGIPGSGDPPSGGSTSECYVWVYDIAMERWAGRFIFPATLTILSGFTAPNADGQFRAVFNGKMELQDNSDGDTGLAGSEWRTGEHVLDEGRPVHLKGAIVTGDWQAMDGFLAFTVFADEATARSVKLFVMATTPSGASAGDVWYDTASNVTKEYDGSSWQDVYGLEPGQVRLWTNERCRTAEIKMSWGNTTTEHVQQIHGYGFQTIPM